MESLIRAGSDVDVPNFDGETQSRLDMTVQILTSMFTGDTAVHEACKTNNLAIAEFVFSNSKNLNNLNSRWSPKRNMSGEKIIFS